MYILKRKKSFRLHGNLKTVASSLSTIVNPNPKTAIMTPIFVIIEKLISVTGRWHNGRRKTGRVCWHKNISRMGWYVSVMFHMSCKTIKKKNTQSPFLHIKSKQIITWNPFPTHVTTSHRSTNIQRLNSFNFL